MAAAPRENCDCTYRQKAQDRLDREPRQLLYVGAEVKGLQLECDVSQGTTALRTLRKVRIPDQQRSNGRSMRGDRMQAEQETPSFTIRTQDRICNAIEQVCGLYLGKDTARKR